MMAYCAGRSGTAGMADPISQSGPIDLDALDDYLMSDHAPDDSMGLSDLDGFLTGIAVGPELILPSEWLPVIWGRDEPEFKSEEEMRTVLWTIMGRYNQIVACFNGDPEEFDPIFWEGPEGEIIASDWAGGFLDVEYLQLLPPRLNLCPHRYRALNSPAGRSPKRSHGMRHRATSSVTATCRMVTWSRAGCELWGFEIDQSRHARRGRTVMLNG